MSWVILDRLLRQVKPYIIYAQTLHPVTCGLLVLGSNVPQVRFWSGGYIYSHWWLCCLQTRFKMPGLLQHFPPLLTSPYPELDTLRAEGGILDILSQEAGEHGRHDTLEHISSSKTKPVVHRDCKKSTLRAAVVVVVLV